MKKIHFYHRNCLRAVSKPSQSDIQDDHFTATPGRLYVTCQVSISDAVRPVSLVRLIHVPLKCHKNIWTSDCWDAIASECTRNKSNSYVQGILCAKQLLRGCRAHQTCFHMCSQIDSEIDFFSTLSKHVQHDRKDVPHPQDSMQRPHPTVSPLRFQTHCDEIKSRSHALQTLNGTNLGLSLPLVYSGLFVAPTKSKRVITSRPTSSSSRNNDSSVSSNLQIVWSEFFFNLL